MHSRYDSSGEKGKNTLRRIEKPISMFKKLLKEIETKLISVKFDSEEKVREQQRKNNNIEIWYMRYLKNYSIEFSQYYYKIGHNETNQGMFYDKLSYLMNSIINENTLHGLKKGILLIPQNKNIF